ncbi:hypothetical protein LZ686_00610 [Paracoccus sp. NFXS7]|uniref:hypothetical protein n=1 Tax=Paracoccus sp. NFXS7 TaxID=2908653 RepID=UPI0032DE58E3
MFSLSSETYPEWTHHPSNRLSKKLLELAEQKGLGGNIAMVWAPASRMEKSIGCIQRLAEKAVQRPIVAFAIDFGREGADMWGVYRTNLTFFSPDKLKISGTPELRHFEGTYLGFMTHLVSEMTFNSAEIERLFALIDVSFSGISIGATSLITTLQQTGELAPLGNADFIIPGVEPWADLAFLDGMNTDLPDRAVVALRAASSQLTQNDIFTFTWIAFEFAIGDGAARKAFETELNSIAISRRLKEIREIRGGVLKNNKLVRPITIVDINLIRNLIGVSLIQDIDKKKRVVSDIEIKLEADGIGKSFSPIYMINQNND